MVDYLGRIKRIKIEALQHIENAAKEGNIQVITYQTQVVKEAERLAETLKQINREISSLEKKANADSDLKNTQKPSKVVAKGLSNKERASNQRDEFVDKLRSSGIKLSQLEKTIYKTSKGKVVGIAFASEQVEKPGHWFLGLQDRDYDFMVLLCGQEDQDTPALVLPRSFFKTYQPNISKSGGQLKINVLTDNHQYYIRIPKTGGVNISKYLNDIDLLAN